MSVDFCELCGDQFRGHVDELAALGRTVMNRATMPPLRTTVTEEGEVTGLASDVWKATASSPASGAPRPFTLAGEVPTPS
ncbi:hypothetical protein ABTZ93_43470 [Streptomyces sp. NPDC097941]|uniref:hypothetical protein n=1 Tax=Streptomyces sp. NPDC097941 TaxID=3155685 RepID=UPI0033184EA0